MKKTHKASLFIVLLGLLFILTGFLFKVFHYPKALPLASVGLLMGMIGLIFMLYPPKAGK
jgi:hypothetical protein